MSTSSKLILRYIVPNFKRPNYALLGYVQRHSRHSKPSSLSHKSSSMGNNIEIAEKLPNLNYRAWKKRQKEKNKMYRIKQSEYDKYENELNAIKDSTPMYQESLEEAYKNIDYTHVIHGDQNESKVGEVRNEKSNAHLDVKEDKVSMDDVYGKKDLTSFGMKIVGVCVFIGVGIMMRSN